MISYYVVGIKILVTINPQNALRVYPRYALWGRVSYYVVNNKKALKNIWKRENICSKVGSNQYFYLLIYISR